MPPSDLSGTCLRACRAGLRRLQHGRSAVVQRSSGGRSGRGSRPVRLMRGGGCPRSVLSRTQRRWIPATWCPSALCGAPNLAACAAIHPPPPSRGRDVADFLSGMSRMGDLSTGGAAGGAGRCHRPRTGHDAHTCRVRSHASWCSTPSRTRPGHPVPSSAAPWPGRPAGADHVGDDGATGPDRAPTTRVTVATAAGLSTAASAFSPGHRICRPGPEPTGKGDESRPDPVGVPHSGRSCTARSGTGRSRTAQSRTGRRFPRKIA